MRAWEALEQTIIGKAVDLLSGPGGLASFLRRRQLGARLGGPSLPLDVGVARDIPAAIRHAVILRDKHCQWTGGRFLTKKIPPSCSAAADLCGDMLNWTRDSWWFRAWSGRYEVCPGGASRRLARRR